MARASKDRSKLYMCIGENFRHNAPIGDCGEIKSLIEWLKHLSHKEEDELSRFFDESYTNKDIAEYIYGSYGKRLQEIK